MIHTSYVHPFVAFTEKTRRVTPNKSIQDMSETLTGVISGSGRGVRFKLLVAQLALQIILFLVGKKSARSLPEDDQDWTPINSHFHWVWGLKSSCFNPGCELDKAGVHGQGKPGANSGS